MNQTTNDCKLGTGDYVAICDDCIAAFGLEAVSHTYPRGPVEYARCGDYINPHDCQACPDATPGTYFERARVMYQQLLDDGAERTKLAHVYRALYAWHQVASQMLLSDAMDYIWGPWHRIEGDTFDRELGKQIDADPA